MERFLLFCHGYVQIYVSGEQKERFLNLCKSAGMILLQVKWDEKNRVTAVVSLKDFFRLWPIRRKTHVHIGILKKCGLPFFFQRNRKRKAFFMGILLCVILVQLCSVRIWNIHIEGNRKNSTSQILEFLETENITHGILKRKVNCREVADAVRKKFPEIAWVSVKMSGTRLIVHIQEGNYLSLKNEETSPAPCSITADKEGRIVKMITRQGLPLMQPGDTCKKGDVLVLGRIDILNDSQEAVRYEYVHADADIYVEHSLPYYLEFPLSYEQQLPTGKTAAGYYVRIGNFYFGTGVKKKKNWNTIVTDTPLRLTENFLLPISLGKENSFQYQTKKASYTEEEAKKIAISRLHVFEQNLMEKGVQISENNVKIEITQTACISRGTLTVTERTGTDTAISSQEQPQYKERTAEDGQQHY